MARQDTAVQVIIGLGNPGPDYRHNRHNLGFMVVEELARRLGLVFHFGGPAFEVATGGRRQKRIFLLKPLSYMNRSGEAVAVWSRLVGVALEGRPGAEAVIEAESGVRPPEVIRPLVVCDDLNLPLGSVRLRPNGSSGGQNGLASVMEHLGGGDFPRLRLGIAPLAGQIAAEGWPDFVTSDFGPEERAAAADLVDHAAAALEFWLDYGLEATISRFNRRIRPEEP